jgi:hypothetical protein
VNLSTGKNTETMLINGGARDIALLTNEVNLSEQAAHLCMTMIISLKTNYVNYPHRSRISVFSFDMKGALRR